MHTGARARVLALAPEQQQRTRKNGLLYSTVPASLAARHASSPPFCRSTPAGPHGHDPTSVLPMTHGPYIDGSELSVSVYCGSRSRRRAREQSVTVKLPPRNGSGEGAWDSLRPCGQNEGNSHGRGLGLAAVQEGGFTARRHESRFRLRQAAGAMPGLPFIAAASEEQWCLVCIRRSVVHITFPTATDFD